MLNGIQNQGKNSSSFFSLIKIRWLLRPLSRLRKWIISSGFTGGLYRLGWCITVLFLVSMLLGGILLSNILTLVTIFIFGTLGYWKVASSRKRRRWLQRQLLRLKKWISRASLAQWLYLLVFCAIALFPVSVLLEVIQSFNTLTLMKTSMYGALGCFAVGFMSEIKTKVKTHWKSPLLKVFLAFLAGSITVVSPLLSRYLINSLTRVDPSHLPFAVSTLVVVLIPIAWLALAVVSLVLFYSLFIVLMPIFIGLGLTIRELLLAVRNSGFYRFPLRQPKVPHRTLSFWEVINGFLCWSGRAMGAGALALALTWLLTSVFSQYPDQIDRFVANVIVYTNYQPISDECKNYNKGESIASLGTSANRKISVAIPDGSGGYKFQTRSCN